MNKISIIIPVYREEKNIEKSLSNLIKLDFGKSEIIIVDGSDDDLTKIAVNKFECIKYIKNLNSSRASSMNIGASNSTGNLLVFLHVDTLLPAKAYNILSTLNLTKYSYGGFYKKFYPNCIKLNILSFFNNISLSLFKNILGDNTIFISKKLFNSIGGYNNIRLMEDVEISKSLKNVGNIKIIKDFSITSSRKFQKKGVIKTIIFMQYMRFLYFIGVSGDSLEMKYRKF